MQEVRVKMLSDMFHVYQDSVAKARSDLDFITGAIEMFRCGNSELENYTVDEDKISFYNDNGTEVLVIK